MFTEEQLKDEIRKKLDELSKYDRSFLFDVREACIRSVYIKLYTYYDVVLIRPRRDVITDLSIVLVSAVIVDVAHTSSLLGREKVEWEVDEICKMIVDLFPQHMWEDVLKKVNEYINREIHMLMQIRMRIEKG